MSPGYVKVLGRFPKDFLRGNRPCASVLNKLLDGYLIGSHFFVVVFARPIDSSLLKY